jgi:hypothetical protein
VDPLAELVAFLADDKGGPGWKGFDQALAGGIASVEAPAPELAAFFREVERVPAWLDRQLIARAGSLYHRTFWGARRGLFSASLLAGYAASGIVKPLVATAALERSAVRRVDLAGRPPSFMP